MKIRLIMMAGAIALSGCSALNGSTVSDAGASERPLEDDKIYICCEGGGGGGSPGGPNSNAGSKCSDAIETNGIFSCASDKVLFGCDINDGSIVRCEPKSDAALDKINTPPATLAYVHVFCCPDEVDPNKSTEGCEKPKQSGKSGGFTVWSCGKKVTWECDGVRCTK